MKIICITLIMIVLATATFSQTTFSLRFNSPKQQVPGYLLELSDHSFMLTGITSEYYGAPRYSIFYHINENGLINDSIMVSNPDGDCLYCCLNEVNDSLIYASGMVNWYDETSSIQLMALSPLLERYWNTSFRSPLPFTDEVDAIINKNGNILLASCVKIPSIPLYFRAFLLESSKNGDSIRSNMINPPQSGYFVYFTNVIEDKLNDTYKLPVTIFNYSSPTQLLTIDSTLNLLSVNSIPDFTSCSISMLYDTDTSYFMAGNQIQTNGDGDDIALMQLNQNNDKLASAVSGKPGEIADYAAYKQSVDFKYKTHIYAGGTSNQLLIPDNFGDQDSWFVLSRYDSVLNLNWTRFYGGDAYYFMRGLTATLDKGCIMWGGRYDFRAQDMQQDIFLIKVDEEGVITDLDNPGLKAHDAIVYPNPGKEQVFIESGAQINGAVFVLFDMQGRPVLTQTLQQSKQQLDVLHLPSGSYPWRIIHNGKVVDEGVWVKQ